MPEFLEVTERSPLLTESSDCIYCHSDLLLKDRVVICDYCSSPHHQDCWQANSNRCATFGCQGNSRSIRQTTTRASAATTRPRRPTQQGYVTGSGRNATLISAQKMWHRIFIIAILIGLSYYVFAFEMDPALW